MTVEEWIDPRTAAADVFTPRFTPLAFSARSEEFLFFDLETTGFGARASIFLAGYLYWENGRLHLVQEVAADGAEEALLVRSARERMARHPRVVTYNGRSFDVPLLKRRLRHHRQDSLPEEVEVIDLLYAVRRRYKKELPNCKLSTVERDVIEKERTEQDVPGSEAPLHFFDFVETRKREHLDPVLYHNRVDLTTLAALYPMVCDLE